MTAARDHAFDTTAPVRLRARLGRGSLTVTAEDTVSTSVRVAGQHAGDVVVDLHDGVLSVTAPQHRGFVERDVEVDVDVVLPTGSDLDVRLGTADLRAAGSYGAGSLRSGSGDLTVDTLTGATLVETGSGDVRLDRVQGELQVKSGSGDVVVEHASAAVAVSTGSGDVRLGEVQGDLAVKTGSGDLHVARHHGDVMMTSGSGDVVVDRAAPCTISLRGASTDVQVAIPTDLPVWTDITSVTGSVRADTSPRGEPTDDRPHLTLRVSTVSGDVHLVDA
ncbi:DUF4097 family beta strand repeat-containing protein [Nocardioides sp. AX2bis]|uniref:DUF4097 family beta strand repeat-containing protein n=1 Tax=Nocardioides sp. AX2bis TaxID=2653157 RepID=UPI0012EF2EBE|nr:DUF4097 family beta strand repeat-containing protein [Nocardioides sp. AX2bis]VXB98429.1 conserved hypothetical protein [Nocardioides sp. AX2bis]